MVRRHDQVACEYVGETRPSGLVGWLLAPSGGVVRHFDRFYLPSVVEVEYALGESHILVNACLSPLSDHLTALHAVVSVKTRIPGWLLRPLVKPIALRIFNQDRRILKLQTNSLAHGHGARFVSTELDVLGPQILRLLRQAANGKLDDPDTQVCRDSVMRI